MIREALSDLAADDLRRQAGALRDGGLVILRKAFRDEFAREVHAALLAVGDWQIYEHYSARFAYHHHNLYDPRSEPPALQRAREIFSGSRAYLSQLAHVETGGETQCSASLYLPGDYSLPHTDRDQRRTLAFVWHLCPNWRPEWGGHLYWGPTAQYLAPTFNTLVLFRVTDESHHFVCPVSAYATGRRLSVNGWWTRP